ncbi:hypothetical protein K502DRAFT_80184 [Neoconidiobolus thromboides FSU 785]|nr:hypothetical protein K502DRAFT_80184 [Neoconidiobolus thromboides FSU 785]
MSSNNDTSNEAHNQAPIEAIPEPTLIEEGIISKRGPFPLRLWQKRYLAFPSSHQGFSLYQLRTVYKKNVKKSQSNRAEFEKANKDLFETLATATVNTNAILAYYKVNAKDLPQGLINLKHVKSVERAPRIKSNAFIIHSKNRDYVFSAPSKDETDLWVTSIQNRLNSEMFDYDDTEAFKFSYDHLGKPLFIHLYNYI